MPTLSLSLVIRSIPDGIVILNAMGTVVYANAATRALPGKRVRQFITYIRNLKKGPRPDRRRLLGPHLHTRWGPGRGGNGDPGHPAGEAALGADLW